MTDDPDPLVAIGTLHEYRFTSQSPVVGPIIARLRAAWYNVAARWGDQSVMSQQTAYNHAATQRIAVLTRQLAELEQHLLEADQRIILADHDLTHLTRTVAELTQQVIQLRQAVTEVKPHAEQDE